MWLADHWDPCLNSSHSLPPSWDPIERAKPTAYCPQGKASPEVRLQVEKAVSPDIGLAAHKKGNAPAKLDTRSPFLMQALVTRAMNRFGPSCTLSGRHLQPPAPK